MIDTQIRYCAQGKYDRFGPHKWQICGQAKNASAPYSPGLPQRHADDGATSNTAHPGGIMTGLQKHLVLEEMRALGWLKADDTPLDMFKFIELRERIHTRNLRH